VQVLFVELLAPAEDAVYLRPKERKIYEVAGDAVPCTKMTGLFPKAELAPLARYGL
jgi:hypothetical protein